MNRLFARAVRAMALLLAVAANACSTDGGHADGSATADARCGPCPLWTVRCGTKCVDPTVSPDNCGVCGVACDSASQVCQGGVCVNAGRCSAISAGGLSGHDAGAPDVVVADAVDADASAPPVTDADVADGAAGDAAAPVPAGAGLRGEYFGNATLGDLRFVRLDPNIDFDWTGAPPATGYPAENFSVRWTGTLRAPATGTYHFHVTADDGARVWIDGDLVLDAWSDPALVDARFDRMLVASHPVSLRFEYVQLADMTSVHFLWSSGTATTEAAVPATAFAPALGDAYTCSTGECCAVHGAALCCPTGMSCVDDPTFTGCCPAGETCTAVPACGNAP